MRARFGQWLKDASRVDLLFVAIWGSLAVLAVVTHRGSSIIVAYAAACWAFAVVAGLRVELRRAKRIPANSVLLTSPVEPSSDARQAARILTDYRNALIGQGMSPREATEFMAAWASKAGGAS